MIKECVHECSMCVRVFECVNVCMCMYVCHVPTRSAFVPGNLDEAVVEAQVVAYRVLPALSVEGGGHIINNLLICS